MGLTPIPKPNLTKEAKEYINFWKMKPENLMFFKGHCNNWILMYNTEKAIFYSISNVDGCKSSTFGDRKHLDKCIKERNLKFN